jgi:hypothetical protein
MVITLISILAVAALIFVLAHMASQAWSPLWLTVLILVIIEILRVIPLGR